MKPERMLLWAMILTLTIGVGRGFTQPLTFEELQKLPRDCPIIYDNDWLTDTPDDEYLFSKVALGQANLRGIILTKDLWDQGRHYTIQQGLEDFKRDLNSLRQSGFRKIPEVTLGVDRMLVRPISGRIEDTPPIPSPGTSLIVREARRAKPSKPLLVFVGGPINTVASAYLTDPSIASKMIVLTTDLKGYNGQDAWANYVVATRCKLVNFGADRIWWPQRPDPPVMPLERFDSLPDSEVTRDLRRLAQSFWERSSRKENPVRDDGFGDGAGLFLFFKPRTWLELAKVRVTGVFTTVEVSSGTYHYLDAREVDFSAMREEFFTTLGRALKTLQGRK